MFRYIVLRDTEKKNVISCLIEGTSGKSLELMITPEDAPLQVGEIYTGTVTASLPRIGASFISAGKYGNCYLDECACKTGSDLTVQVKREAYEKKAACVTATLSLQGEYVVVMLPQIVKTSHPVGVSQKLSSAARERLHLLGEDLIAPYSDSRQLSVIMRTAAAAASEDEVRAEFSALAGRLIEIADRAGYRPSGTCMYRPPRDYLCALDRLEPELTEKIVTDDPVLLDEIRSYIEGIKDDIKREALLRCCSLHEDPMISLSALHSILHRLDEARMRTAYVSDGCSLVIEQTEALVSIDINSSKGTAGGRRSGAGKEEAVLAMNIRAAKEAARQIRLRNLSGIILIDFINMEENASKEALLSQMREFVKNDPVPVHVVDITKLGLMELTRKKMKKSLNKY